ncbi:MAG TPA: 23S rRNA (adenine(2030)-N(6))-methyltransferase RlmJ [Methylomirabilota bacterium]|nr:23S rRNA (adenine(2030)-N(6))-methyltransferase RlmJ [Methylomirabilota bacterium]
MNYRHTFHAGNFADVVKHAILARILTALNRKEAPYRVLDTHAGTGLYDLSSDEAARTGEWRGGVARLAGQPLPDDLATFLAPYLAAVRAVNDGDEIRRYPGSPAIATTLGRLQDRYVFNELHSADADALAARFAGDRRVRVMREDGYVAVRSQLPPRERRGLTVIDPPFEEPGEFARLVGAFEDAARRFATGAILAWYPIKSTAAVTAFHAALAGSGLTRLLRVDHWTRAPGDEPGLAAAGLVIMNPPYPIADELAAIMPGLAHRLATGPGAGCRVDWLVPEARGGG